MFEMLKNLFSFFDAKEETAYSKATTVKQEVKVEKRIINTLTKVKKTYLAHQDTKTVKKSYSTPTVSPLESKAEIKSTVKVNYAYPKVVLGNILAPTLAQNAQEGAKLPLSPNLGTLEANVQHSNLDTSEAFTTEVPAPITKEVETKVVRPDNQQVLATATATENRKDNIASLSLAKEAVQATSSTSKTEGQEAKSSKEGLAKSTFVPQSPTLEPSLAEKKAKDSSASKEEESGSVKAKSSLAEPPAISAPLTGGKVITSCNFDLRSISYFKKRQAFRLIDIVDVNNVDLDLQADRVKALLAEIVNEEFDHDIGKVNKILKAFLMRDIQGSQYLGDDIVLLRALVPDSNYLTKAYIAPLRFPALYNTNKGQYCRLLMVLFVGKEEVKAVNQALPDLIAKLKELAKHDFIFRDNLSNDDVWQVLAHVDWKFAATKAKEEQKQAALKAEAEAQAQAQEKAQAEVALAAESKATEIKASEDKAA